jgi:hypothetical protein
MGSSKTLTPVLQTLNLRRGMTSRENQTDIRRPTATW